MGKNTEITEEQSKIVKEYLNSQEVKESVKRLVELWNKSKEKEEVIYGTIYKYDKKGKIISSKTIPFVFKPNMTTFEDVGFALNDFVVFKYIDNTKEKKMAQETERTEESLKEIKEYQKWYEPKNKSELYELNKCLKEKTNAKNN